MTIDIQSTAPRSVEFPALTGLRGLLAIWVVLYHVTCGIELRGVDLTLLLPKPPLNLLHSGALAVEMFFVLSGFIMVHVHARDFTRTRSSAGFLSASFRFWMLRLIRLWPVHAFMLAAYAILDFAGFRWGLATCGNPETHGLACDRFDINDLPNQLLLIAGWGAADVYRWNFVSWSVSAEWLAYVAFPVLVLLISRLTWAAAALLAGAMLIAGVPYQMWLGPTFHGLSDAYSAFRVVPGFLAGCLLGQILTLDGSQKIWAFKPYAAAFAAVVLFVMAATPEIMKWAIIPGAILILGNL